MQVYTYSEVSQKLALVLEQAENTGKANLSRSMQWLGVTYTRRFNLRHFRSGHLFQGRFKSIIFNHKDYYSFLEKNNCKIS